MYHADGGKDDALIDDDDGWLDLGPNNPKEKEAILQAKVAEAKKKGFSNDGFKMLESMPRELIDIVKL